VLDGGAEEFKQRVAPRIPPAWLRYLEEGWPLLFFLAFGIVGYMSRGKPSRRSRRGGFAYASSSDSWSSSSSSWGSSDSSSSSGSFSGGGGDSGGGGASGDY